MKDELNGQMTRLRADCADRVCQLEKQLDLANDIRTASMFQIKDEVTFYLLSDHARTYYCRVREYKFNLNNTHYFLFHFRLNLSIMRGWNNYEICIKLRLTLKQKKLSNKT